MVPSKYKKAVTFSFDDGVTQDKRFVEILNKYDLKCTFNLNSDRFGQKHTLERMGVVVGHDKIEKSEVRALYDGHEVAAHTRNHPTLPGLSREEIISQVEKDRINLSEICGYEVIGMAYPGGGVNHDDRVVEIIKENTGVKYARTIITTGDFALPHDLYRIHPTSYHMDIDDMECLAKKFIELEPEELSVFYIWGHSYEFDIFDSWDRFERFCQLISNRGDIFYGTNKDILL